MAEGKILIELTAKVDKFTADMEKAKKSVESMKKSVDLIKFDSLTNLASRAYQVGQQIYDFGKSIASSANDIDRQSKLIGTSTYQWQRWTYAANMADVSTEALMQSLKFLSQNIMEARQPGTEMNMIFRNLGITTDNLEDAMYGVADAFYKTKDGADKITYATKMMGRGAMEVIPFFNLGKKAIQELGDEGERLGTIVEDNIIKKGSEADEIFKQLGKRFESFKINLAPAAAEIIKFFDAILPGAETLKIVFEEINRTVTDMRRMFEGLGIISEQPARKMLNVPANIEKSALPSIGKVDEYMLLYGQTKEELKEGIAYAKLMLEKWLYGDFSFGYRAEMYAEEVSRGVFKVGEKLVPWFNEQQEKMLYTDTEIRDMQLEGWQSFIDDKKKMQGEYNQYVTETDLDTLAKLQENIALMEKSQQEYYEKMKEQSLDLAKYNAEVDKARFQELQQYAEETARLWDSVFADIGMTAMGSFFSLMEDGFRNMKDWVKSFGVDMLRIMQRLIMNAVVFGNILGQASKGGTYGGLVGLLGGLFNVGTGAGGYSPSGHISNFASGGYVNKPTLSMLGEGGKGEYVIPESKMGKLGGTNIFIYAVDSKSFVDMCRNNPAGILQAVQKDMRGAGGMRSVNRAYG